MSQIKAVLAPGRTRVLAGHGKREPVAEINDLLNPHLELVEGADPVFKESAYCRQARVGAQSPGCHVEDGIGTVEADHPVKVTAVGRFKGLARKVKRAGLEGLLLRHCHSSIAQSSEHPCLVARAI